MKQIRVERRKGYYGMVRGLDLLIDGVMVGKLAQPQAEVYQVPDGSREIWGRMDWGETERFPLDQYQPHQTIVFQGYFTLNPIRNLAIMKIPFRVFLHEEPAA